MPHAPLRHHEGDDLPVEDAVLEAHDAVHPHRDEAPRVALEDGGAERPAVAAEHVLAGDGDGESHLLLVARVAALPVDDVVHPRRVLHVHHRM